MSTLKNFEDLEIWQFARQLVNLIYSDFGNCEDFMFRNQITSAEISVMNNISEGFCRKSNAEFHQFLNISKGSAGEVKNMYYIAEDLGYITGNNVDLRKCQCQQLMNAISALMNYLKRSK